MKRCSLLLLATTLATGTAWAQGSASSQTSASAKSKTSVSVGKSGAQVKSEASASGQAAGSTSTPAQAGQGSASFSSGTTIQAVLVNRLDARKNKEGDQVVARTTQAVESNGKVVIPKGTKLIGHVTQARAKARGESESALGIRFERAVPKKGPEIPLNVAIQAIAAAQTVESSSLGESEMMSSAGAMGSAATSGRAGGGLLGGAVSSAGTAVGAAGGAVGGGVGSTVNTATSATGSVGGRSGGALLNSSSSGVIGLKGLSLASEATQGALIVSSTRNVHLDSGTRMLLRVQGQ